MDVETAVWAAYLEIIEREGRRMTRAEREELRAYRRFLQATARLVAAFDADEDYLWTDADLWS